MQDQFKIMTLEKDYKQRMALIARYDSAYASGKEIVSNETYDFEFSRLKTVIAELETLTGKTYTKPKVGFQETTGTLIGRAEPMLSLDAHLTYESVLEAFDRCGGNPMVATAKIDGIAVETEYNKGRLSRITTRGDGEVGRDITYVAHYIAGFPTFIDNLNMTLVRGELTISFHDFLNTLNPNDNKPYTSPRALVVAAAKSQSSVSKINPRLRLLAYEYVNPPKPMDFEAKLTELMKFGFSIPLTTMGVDRAKLKSVWEFYRDLFNEKIDPDKRDNVGQLHIYVTDGVVFRVGSVADEQRLGVGSRSPNYMFSAKYPRDLTWSKLKEITYQVGGSGAITPILQIQPTDIDGLTFTSINLYNTTHVKGLYRDTEIGFLRGGECGPVFKQAIGGDVTAPLTPPTHCPECHEPLGERPKDTGLFCNNKMCVARVTETIMTSFERLGVKNMTRSLIRSLYPSCVCSGDIIQYVRENPSVKIPSLTDSLKMQLLTIAVTDKEFVSALCIPTVGLTQAGKVTDVVLRSLATGDCDILPKNVPVSTARHISAALLDEATRNNILTLYRNVVITKPKTPNTAGKIVVVSGTIANHTQKQFTEYLNRQGYTVVDRVTKNVDLLLVGENPSSSKLNAAERLNIETRFAVEFL